MPRVIEVSVPSDKTSSLIDRLRGVDGVVGVSLLRGASLDPGGDVLTIQATNEGTRDVLRLLADARVTDGGSIVTSEPRSLIAPQHQNSLDRESNETIWDEMAFLLRRDSNVSANYLSLMALSGGVAAVGLWTDTLHLVIGAMVIAPGFEPLLRIPFGLICGRRVIARRGVASTVAGYVSMAAGAALVLLIMRLLEPGTSADLNTRSWVRYWSSLSGSSVVVALLAGIAGAFTITAQRSVFTAGVMIALALIPSISIAAMALMMGDIPLAGRGLLRWSVDAAAVLVASVAVVSLKQVLIHRRTALS
jgi:uncharacterized hydrophobic protein (TIGR00271 family)